MDDKILILNKSTINIRDLCELVVIEKLISKLADKHFLYFFHLTFFVVYVPTSEITVIEKISSKQTDKLQINLYLFGSDGREEKKWGDFREFRFYNK